MGSALGNGRRALAEEVPVGYKQTEAGVIPEEWQATRIGDLFESTAGGDFDPTRSSDVQSDSHPYPIYANGLSQEGLYGFCNYAENRPGSITVTARGTLGKAFYRDTPFVAIGRLLVLEPKVRMDARFFFNYINHGVHFAVESTGVPQLTAPQVARYLLPVPPESEQRTIAEALSDADGLLAALEALIAKKRAVKQAAMQQLLTGKSRLPGFNGAWETRRLGDTFTCLPTANNPRADLREYGQIGYIHYGDVHAHAQPVLNCAYYNLPRIDKSRVDNAAHLQDGDLVMVDASEDLVGVGKSIEIHGIAGKTVVAGLHTILCRGNPDYWAMGFKAYLQFIPAFKSALIRMATGISVYAISKKQLSDIELALPSLLEQEAIVSVLSDMDAEIAALERRRDKTRAVKQGMMQQLLTGQVRLVESEQSWR